MSELLPPSLTWWEYVQRVTQGASQSAIARTINLSGATVSRWQDHPPKPESAAAFAHAYNRPVLEAFIYAGYLTPQDAEVPVTLDVPGVLTDRYLLDELERRLRR
jgi:hypothetical protein